jgi:predicted permease
MDCIRILLRRCAALLGRKQQDADLDDELRTHIDLLTSEYIARGLPPAGARTAALRDFGGITQTREAYRSQRGFPLVANIARDVRFAFRQLRKSPGFAFTAILTLALGIGANSAIFSVINTVLLHPLAYYDPDRLVLVSENLPQQGSNDVGVSAQEYLDYRNQNRVFSEVAAFQTSEFNLTGVGQPQRINAARISATALPLLGVTPELGRNFTLLEDHYGSDRVVLLSHALWQDQYGADPAVVGKIIHLDETPYVVIGVMPASFRFPLDGTQPSERASLWLPMAFRPDVLNPDNRTMEFGVGLVGRLKQDATLTQAQSEMRQIADHFMQQYGYSGTIRVAPHAYPFAAHSVEKARALLILLAASVLCVLLIACANVANLLLARAGARTQEMALRAAIGANRRSLMRQCLVESALLGLLGSVAGILVAGLLVAGLKRFGPVSLPRLRDVAVHPGALLFALALSLITSLLFGFVPAWRLSRVPPQSPLRAATQAGADRSGQRLQNSVAATEVALALVLLIAGGLLLRSFVRLLDSPFGFNPQNAFIARTIFDHVRYPDPARRDLVQQELLGRLSHLPGVTAVGEASHLPLSDSRQIGFRLEHAAADDFHWAENALVSPGYLRAMGISLIRGRDFTSQDRRDSPPVAIISQTMSRQYFPGRDPVGQRFWWGDRALFTIIGVATDVRVSSLDAEPPPMIYNDMFQIESGASGRTTFILRDQSAGSELLGAIRAQIWSVDSELPLYNAVPLQSLVSDSLAQRRFAIFLLGAFAVFALILASIGVFGVISYLVAQRTREFGVRMALGANRSHIAYLVLSRGAGIGIAGCICGLVLSAPVSRFLQASLYQTHWYDPVMLCLAPALLFAVVLLAAWLPARRAASIDPMRALRTE